MSSFYENKNNKIIEKKISLKKKNNSSSRQWLFENKEIPLNYTLRSTFSKPNSKYFQNENEVNHTKIKNRKIAAKTSNNINQNVQEDESLDYKIKNNIKNCTSNIYINGNKKINMFIIKKEMKVIVTFQSIIKV
jgi:homoserine acetyltransferase